MCMSFFLAVWLVLFDLNVYLFVCMLLLCVCGLSSLLDLWCGPYMVPCLVPLGVVMSVRGVGRIVPVHIVLDAKIL